MAQQLTDSEFFLAGSLRRQAILDAGAQRLLDDLKSFRGPFAMNMGVQVSQGSPIYDKALDVLVRMIAGKRAREMGCAIEHARVSVMRDLEDSQAQTKLGWGHWYQKASAQMAKARQPSIRMG